MENVEVLVDSRKKKAHRRRKAGGKRKKENKMMNNSHDRSLETMSDEAVVEAAASIPSAPVASSSQQTDELREEGEPPRKHVKMMPNPRHPLLRSHRRVGPHHATTRRLLRPATVPKAPQNSTQFIIDDHENSAYFIDFERGFTSPGNRDDVGWSPYFQQDFENVYQTARESVNTDWTHEVLVDKISSLEERVKTLEQQLSMCDPSIYMSQQLQHRIVCTTTPSADGSSRLTKEFRVWCPMHGKKVRLRNPSSETSSEDCSSSSDSQSNDEEIRQNGTETDSSEDTSSSGGEDPPPDGPTGGSSSRIPPDDDPVTVNNHNDESAVRNVPIGEKVGSEPGIQSSGDVVRSEAL